MLTDEQLGQIEERWRTGNDEHAGEDLRAVLDEVWGLRADITRHMEIANEHLAEVERLRKFETDALPVLDAYEHMHTRAVRAEAEITRLRELPNREERKNGDDQHD
jgi:hypothetical protein